MIGAIPFTRCGGGGGGLPPPSQETVLVTPAKTSVAVGDNNPERQRYWIYPNADRAVVIEGAKDAGGSDDCGYLALPLMSSCQFGFVVFGSVAQFPSSAIYYAPLWPGAYHVTFEATQFTPVDRMTKTATATITVTPQIRLNCG